ncbi:MAG: hypothetical protein AMJ42_05220 [Deltaproteobacteria bacterium DG_8]|nr:MAG: hypothetical protein AMJ42_05220 [Deltaproteobacteria bacterium DG_8]
MNKVEERRRFSRFETQLKAKYFIKERKGGWEECTIIDISRNGMKIRFHTCEKIIVNSTVHLEIYVPKELEPIYIKGILKRVKKEESDFIGSIELTEVLDENKLAKLS